MKLKKKVKRILIILVIATALIATTVFFVKKLTATKEVEEAKVLNTIDDYGYVLKDNKSKKYQKLFEELVGILEKKEVDEKEYVSKISEMFIVDFYSLNDKSAKTDVGGVDFVHPSVLGNFLENAENTFYKHVESNIYNNRSQKLPTVDTVTVDSVETTSFTYGDKTDENAYLVKVNWTYAETEFSTYQTNAAMIFVHEQNKLYLVELK